MPIVKSQPMLRVERSDVTLALYAYAVQQVPENIFWGVRRDTDPDYGCETYMIKPERDMLLHALWEAQVEIEQEVCFPLLRRWIANEEQVYTYPVQSKWCHVVDGGVRATTAIATDSAVTHNADDANGNPVDSTVTVATTVTDQAEIRVYYPASLGVEGPVEIDPSDIDITGGVATIYIPRWRLVHPDFANNPRAGIQYDVAANFIAVVDVMRVYHDNSTNATLIWPHQSSGGCTGHLSTCCLTCSEYTQTACIYVKKSEVGQLDVLPAEYSGGSWTRTGACYCRTPGKVLLNYRAGPSELSPQARNAVIRLAHTKMPAEYCGCDVVQRMWAMDRTIPEGITVGQANCRFGRMSGAWWAWQQSQAMRVWRGSVL